MVAKFSLQNGWGITRAMNQLEPGINVDELRARLSSAENGHDISNSLRRLDVELAGLCECQFLSARDLNMRGYTIFRSTCRKAAVIMSKSWRDSLRATYRGRGFAICTYSSVT
eukprot:9218886-Pyramimonas_sp.AAC.2